MPNRVRERSCVYNQILKQLEILRENCKLEHDVPRKAALLSPIKEAGALKYLHEMCEMAEQADARQLTTARRRHLQSTASIQTRFRHADSVQQTSIPKSLLKTLVEKGQL
jgi:hypothetical protein